MLSTKKIAGLAAGVLLFGFVIIPIAQKFLLLRNATTNRMPIWFSPKQDQVNSNGKGVTYMMHDFPFMVGSNSQWQEASSRISVLGLDIPHIVEAYPDVPSVISMVNSGHFHIVSGGGVLYTASTCTVHSEGLSNDANYEQELVKTLHKWKEDGGKLDYLAMDGPFLFGYYAVQKQCNFSIEQVAQRAAITVNLILQDFPDAKIVDYEGVAWVPLATWEPGYTEFLKDFDALSHKPITYLTLDMHWIDAWHTGYQWVPSVRELAEYAHREGLEVGLFMDAEDQFVESADGTQISYQPVTNDTWMQMVRAHMQLAYDKNLPLDYIEIASWMKFPPLNLPETSPSAFTSLVNYAYSLWNK